MVDKKKKFTEPEVEILNFSTEDVILASLTDGGDDPGYSGEDWEA